MSDRWNYQVVEVKPTLLGGHKAETLQEELNRQGRLGWELVNIVVPTVASAALLVFKRAG